MLKEYRLPALFIILCFICMTLIGCQQSIAQTTQAGIKKVDKQTKSIYPGLNLTIETEETETYTLSVSIPIAESEAVNEPIQTWIKEQKDEFLARVSANEQILGKGYQAHLNIQVDTETVVENVYNLIFTSYQFAGGANGQEFVKTFTVDTAQHIILTIHDILNVDEHSSDVIRDLIIDLLKEKEVYSYVMQDQLDKALEDPDEWKWSINKKSFTIYFDEYEVAAGAAGTIQVNIPLDKISSYLHENMAQQLEIPREQKPHEDMEEGEETEKELDPEGKYVALTFDDGPSPKVTQRILAILEEHQAKATFFMLGTQVDYYPHIAKEVMEAEHEIGNHTADHMDLTKLDEEKMKEQIEEASIEIKAATEITPILFRPPYGSFNEEVVKVAKEYDNLLILWTVDSLDWKKRDAREINKVIRQEVFPGSIVLMHDIYTSTADALPMLLTSLKEEGYEFVTVSQLLSLLSEKEKERYYYQVTY